MKKNDIKRIVGLLMLIGSISVLTFTPKFAIERDHVNAAYEESQIVIMEDSEVYTVAQSLIDTVEFVSEPTPTTNNVERSDIFEITAYCGENYPHICNNGDATTTATGSTPTAGRTIAVDPNIIPYGSQVIIDGHIYVAEDCGGAIKGNRIDLFFNTHEEALNWGRRTKEVTIIY